MTKPAIKTFTKEHPCNKINLWNCFKGSNSFLMIPVVTAQSQIGLNVPRVLEREGRMVRTTEKGVDYYVLTGEGEAWLTDGMRRYLKNHPAKVREANHLLPEWGYPTGRIAGRLRRTR